MLGAKRPEATDDGSAFSNLQTMEQKSHRARGPVTAVTRVSAGSRRCAHGGSLTAAKEKDAIRLASAVGPPRAKGGVEVVEAYFDPDGRPIKRKGLGAARVARAYDAKGNQVEEAYFNAEGKPTVRKDLGAARISWRYDDLGNQVEAALFGADGAPLRRKRRGAKRAFESV